MKTFSTLTELLSIGEPSRVAIAAPGRLPLTFEQLRTQVVTTIAALNQSGIGRGDRVAIVLPNGPEMASAFVCVAAGATAAPLNPAYRAEEFDFLSHRSQRKSIDRREQRRHRGARRGAAT